MSEALHVDRLSTGYGVNEIVRRVSLRVEHERIGVVLGPNGSGKSTLIKAIAGLLPAWHGRIQTLDTDVTGLTAPARARAGMAYVPQEGNVFPNLTVDENLRLATEFLSKKGSGGASRRDEVLSLFPDLRQRLRHTAGELSGGQGQMLALASALIASPSVLLLDEPSAGLSPRYVNEIFETVRRVSRTGVAILMVEQNVKAALEVGQDAIVLVAGELRVAATTDELRARNDLHELFMGTAP